MKAAAVPAGSRARRALVHSLVTGCELPAVGLLRLLRALPWPISVEMARPLGHLCRAGMRDTILARRRMVLGPRAAAEAEESDFWEEHLLHVGRTIVEAVSYHDQSDEELLERMAIEGEEHLRAALARGRGAILFLHHLGNPGAIVGGLGLRGYDLTIAGNRIDFGVGDIIVPLDRIESTVQRLFARGRVRRALLGEDLPRVVAATLLRNGVFAMFVDFPVVQKHSHWVRFGAARMSVNLGPALLALRRRAEVLCVTCARIGDNRHVLRIHEPLAAPAADASRREAAVEMIAGAMRTLSDQLGAHAAQWWPWDRAEIATATEP